MKSHPYKMSFAVLYLALSSCGYNPYKKVESKCNTCASDDSRPVQVIDFSLGSWVKKTDPWTPMDEKQAVTWLYVDPVALTETLLQALPIAINANLPVGFPPDMKQPTEKVRACRERAYGIPVVHSDNSLIASTTLGHCDILRNTALTDGSGSIKDTDIIHGYKLTMNETVADGSHPTIDAIKTQHDLIDAFPFASISAKASKTMATELSVLLAQVDGWNFNAVTRTESTPIEKFFALFLGANKENPFTAKYDPTDMSVTLNGTIDIVYKGPTSNQFPYSVIFPVGISAAAQNDLQYRFFDFKIKNPNAAKATDPFLYSKDAILSGQYSLFLDDTWAFGLVANNKACELEAFQILSNNKQEDLGAIDLCRQQ